MLLLLRHNFRNLHIYILTSLFALKCLLQMCRLAQNLVTLIQKPKHSTRRLIAHTQVHFPFKGINFSKTI